MDTRLCGYLPGKHRAAVIYTNNIISNDKTLRHDFHLAAAQKGFELMGGAHRVTLNKCFNCQACVQVRIRVGDFKFSREQLRTLHRHNDLVVTRRNTHPGDEQYELYAAYTRARYPHSAGNVMFKRDFDDSIQNWQTLQTLHLPEKTGAQGGELVGTLYYEDCGSALILGHQYYSRDIEKRSFGSFAILSLIKMAQERGGVDHIYLGPWVKGSASMDYKKHFHPLEAFDGTAWTNLDPDLDYLIKPPPFENVYWLELGG